ncbi:MAG: glycoside hydrolase family 2 [Kiritimatiellae bacterium]|nr:glycoside hydrolase family 2 [Kiritimatiellia bacterium]
MKTHDARMSVWGLGALFCASGAVLTMNVANGELPTGRFSHEMPKATNEKPSNPAYAEMAAGFRDPFGKVQTGCYWYWMAGNVSSEGVRKDLEAMKRAGIERAYIGDIGGGGVPPGPVKTFSPEWEKALATAFETASRLGMEIGIFNSPGWSQSGGPWVKPEMAMRRIVSSSIIVDGPKRSVVLPVPKFEYAPVQDARDVLAVAYPVPAGFCDRLETKDEKDSLLVRGGKPLVVEFPAGKPFTAQGVELAFSAGKIAGKVLVESEKDGTWRKVCEMPFTRMNHGGGVTFAPHAPILASFAAETATKFRVTVTPTNRDNARFASVAVCGAPLVARAYEKSLAKMHETPLPMWNEYKWPAESGELQGTALDPSKAVVLRGKVAPDGTLDWDVPAGRWVIYRFAAAPTGTKNGPANPEATGYEVDKMSRAHVAAHFDAYLGKILARTPPEHRKSIRHAVLDSYEQGGQNYTDDFAAKFKASFGYDPLPYLPALSGMSAGSRADTDRFLWDLRRFVADEVAYSYVGGLRAASNRHGLGTWLECYGHWGFPGEFLLYGGQSDAIAGEFWSTGSLGDIENRAASSCGHTYGKRQIWAESNTSGGPAFSRGPMDLKSRTDRFFCEGINAAILHLYIHQSGDRAPGIIAWFGNEFNRHNSWFEHFDLFTGYLKRCGYLLQQGLYVADVAYFIGEDAPAMTGVCHPELPAGRQFDYINAEVLVDTAGVDDKGRIVLPHGTAYEVLVLPPLDTMRPKTLEKLERLVLAGATVLGPKPSRSPSLAGQPAADARVKGIADRLWGEVDGKTVKSARRGKGTIAWGLPLDEALAMRGSAPDFLASDPGRFSFAHRTMPAAEVYFVTAKDQDPVAQAEVSFRTSGRVPEIWDAATGEIREPDAWRTENGRTSVLLSLAANESLFVVFAKEAGKRSGSDRCTAYESIALDGPWTLSFQSDALHRGPSAPVTVPKLFDLSTSEVPEIKYYSGKVVYTKDVELEGGKPGGRSILNLGEVAVTAKVKVNGIPAGGVCFAPYKLDVSRFVKPGRNKLEIEVCDLWVNRLIGDDGDKSRPTWTSKPCWSKDSKLCKAGLIGPVRIER